MVAVIQFQKVVKQFSLAHEIGHLFGCEHDDVKSTKADFNKDYEYGYYVDYPAAHEMHTVMA